MTVLTVTTERAVQALDVTGLVREGLSGTGIYLVSCPHTTAALLLMENDEDLLRDLERVAAQAGQGFGPLSHHKNNNPNGAAHLTSAALGTQVLLPVEDSAPALGAYQRIVFLELDGPRERRVEVRRLNGP